MDRTTKVLLEGGPWNGEFALAMPGEDEIYWSGPKGGPGRPRSCYRRAGRASDDGYPIYEHAHDDE